MTNRRGYAQSEDAARGTESVDIRRWEIAENLHRSELSALERDEHVAEWVRLTDISPPPVAKPTGRPEGGVRAAARELGVNREDARRAVKTAALAPEAKEAARETKLDDNRSALLEAAKAETPAAQVHVIRSIAARGKVAAEPASGMRHPPASPRLGSTSIKKLCTGNFLTFGNGTLRTR